MPLPDSQTPWPPKRHASALGHMAEWSAWYGGDPSELVDYYTRNARALARVRPSQLDGGVVGRVARWWWGTPAADGEQDAKLHVPLAADICGTSADLLFSEQIKLTGDNDSLTEALTALQAAGLDAQLHEAAEVGAALGGSYLRVVWDEKIADLPWSDAVDADMALPDFRWGRLAAVTFWSKLPEHGGKNVVWRLLERHEPGIIQYGLYEGRDDNLGTIRELDAHPDTEHLAQLVGDDGGVQTGTDRLTATYIPNMLPNRQARGSNQGRSDLQGTTGWLDALDEAYSSWWRDIRHAKSRLHVPATYLESLGAGNGALARVDRELYVPVEGVLQDPSKPALMIEATQFKIRVTEHRETCQFWTDKIIESAGYSTQSLSSGTNGAVTAAEVRSHERRSLTTRGKKIRYWTAAIVDHLTTLVEVANANLGAGIREGDIKVEFPDDVQDSALSLAQTAQALRVAEAASTKTLVGMVHPDWDETQVDAEVALIDDAKAQEPVPVPGDAGF